MLHVIFLQTEFNMDTKDLLGASSSKAGSDQQTGQYMLLGFDPASVLEGEIEIQALDAFATVANLIPPSVPYLAQLNGENLGWRRIQKDNNAVQIHFVPPGHYIVSRQHNGLITLYDSLRNPRRIEQILPQLKVMYMSLDNVLDPHQLIAYVVPQSQGCTADCGLFAAANALLLISGGDPRNVTFCQQKMRQHLYQCLRSQSITQFPVLAVRNVGSLSKRKMPSSEGKLSNQDNHQPPKKVTQLEKQTVFYQTLFRSENVQSREDKKEHDSLLGCPVSSRTARKERDRARKMRSRECVEQREKEILAKKIPAQREKEKQHKQEKRQSAEQREKENVAKKKPSQRAKEKLHKQEKRQSAEQREKENLAKKMPTQRAKQKLHKQEKRQSAEQREKENLAKKNPTQRAKEKLHKQEKRESTEQREKENLAKKKPTHRAKEKLHKQEKRLSAEQRKKENLAKKKIAQRAKEKERKHEKRQSAEQREKEHLAKKMPTQRAKQKLHKQEKRQSAEQREKENLAKKKPTQRAKEKLHKQEKRQSAEQRVKENIARKTPKQRAKDKQRKEEKRQDAKEKERDYNVMIQSFKEACKEVPVYICCICYRFQFRKQIVSFVQKKYIYTDLAKRCAIDTPTHEKLDDCDKSCPKCSKWICKNCHYHIQRGYTPNQAWANNLGLCERPDILQKLNQLEKHLISPMIPFMKIMTLPKGLQKGIHGPVVCVPCDLPQVTNTLPRPINDETMVKVKLKRKMEYKGHHLYQNVSVTRIYAAIDSLKKCNPHYKGNIFQACATTKL